MKDNEARKMINKLRKELYANLNAINERITIEFKGLPDISIKDCPKCKHPVLAQEWKPESTMNLTFYCTTTSSISSPPPTYQCLTCGSKFTCEDKCVYELMDADKEQ